MKTQQKSNLALVLMPMHSVIGKISQELPSKAELPVLIPSPRWEIMNEALDKPHGARMLLFFTATHSEDECLCQLVVGMGRLATQIEDSEDPRKNLERIFVHAFGWLLKLNKKLVFIAIHEERERQEDLCKSGRFAWCVSTPDIDAHLKLRVLVEEVGEVANALDRLATNANQTNLEHLITELVQVAAVCVGWLEALDTVSGHG